MNSIEERRRRHFRMSSEIAHLDSAGQRSLLDSGTSWRGWGRNHTVAIGEDMVFVKRVPITDREMDSFLSTRNLYDLPTFYNYGVGSAGFNVFRELVANIKTTNWVLDGETELFPLLYHYRVSPRERARESVDMARHRSYIEYWGGNENIGTYLLDRAAANYELVLYFEHFPHVLQPYLAENPHTFTELVRDLLAAAEFLESKAIVHFDAHPYNVVTDGNQAYLADFGLVLDSRFDLSNEERGFFAAHTQYDTGLIMACSVYLLDDAYKALSDASRMKVCSTYGIEEGADGDDLRKVLLDNLEEIYADHDLNLSQEYVRFVVKHLETIRLIRDFTGALSKNHRKDDPYPTARLNELLASR